MNNTYEDVVLISSVRTGSINGRKIYFKDYTRLWRDRNIKKLTKFLEDKFGINNMSGLNPMGKTNIVVALYYKDELDPISFYTVEKNSLYLRKDLAEEFLNK